MDLVFALLFCANSITTSQDKRVITHLAKLDSVPLQSVHLVNPSLSTGKQVNRRRLTLVIKPAKSRLGDGVTLPIGVDANTVVVRANNAALKPGEDYVLVAGENQIRILNRDVLKSKHPLSITYEQPSFAYKP